MKAKDTHWLNGQSVKVYSVVLLVITLGGTAMLLLSARHMVDPSGAPLGYDFITFWSASLAALQGHAKDAYATAKLIPFERIAVPASSKTFGFFYPPGFYLLILGLAKIPYFAAYWVWGLVGLAIYVAVFRQVLKGAVAMLCLAAFPGLWLNFVDGQNGFLTAALAAGVILCMKRRPVLAGVLLGLLTMKPHLVLLFVVGLVAVRAWRTLAVAAATAAGVTAAGVGVLGVGTLKAWLGSMGIARGMLESGALNWEKMPTIFAMARMCHASLAVAYGLHGVGAAAAAVAVWKIWRGSEDWGLRGAAAMAGTFLISPYVFDYDLAWLAFPVAWMVVVGLRDGWRKGERDVLALAFALPMVSLPIASSTHVQVGPLVFAALVWMAYRRVFVAETVREGSGAAGVYGLQPSA